MERAKGFAPRGQLGLTTRLMSFRIEAAWPIQLSRRDMLLGPGLGLVSSQDRDRVDP
jgi:hypothetical protein